jgi:HSP20 family molecular chaperone IbpA
MAKDAAVKFDDGSHLRVYTGVQLGQLEARIQEAIARRAYDLYEGRGRQHGSDLVDWFGAEQEIQHPQNVAVTEEGSRIEVKASASGFSASELEIGVNPQRVVIWGLKARREDSSQGAAGFGALLGDVSLPAPVDPSKSVATFKDGRIEVHLTKQV